MSRLIPHPMLSVALVLFWMVLTSFSPRHLLLGSMIALVAGRAMAALHPERPRIRRWSVVPRLLWTLFMDVLRSNIAVTRLILTEGNGKRSSTFLVVPLTLRSQNALAVLSIIVTSTPGTAWIEYVSETGMLTVHIFDDKEAEHYRKVIKETYEPMLMEIFE